MLVSLESHLGTAASRTDRVAIPCSLVDFLSEKRRQELQSDDYAEEYKAAQNAMAAVASPRHPCRTLMEHLIADNSAWQILSRHWNTLVDNMANWDILRRTCKEKDVAQFRARLKDYGLTPSAASALVLLLSRTAAGTFLHCSLNLFTPY